MAITATVHSGAATATASDLTNSTWYGHVTITNRSPSATPIELWVRTDGTAAVVGADQNYVVLAQQSRTFTNLSVPNQPGSGVVGTTPVSVIASSSCNYTIEYA